MSGQLLASKIVIEEEEPRVRAIPGVSTSEAGFAGVAERGPIGAATMVQSTDEYDAIFGGYTGDGELKQSLDGFFTNGGQTAHVLRTVHYADITDPASRTSARGMLSLLSGASVAVGGSVLASLAGPYPLAPGDTLVVDTDDAAAPATTTFNASRASRESTAGPFALTDGMVLTVSLNGAPPQTVTFNAAEFATIGAATAAEVAAVLGAQLLGGAAQVVNANKATIFSDRLGTGSGVNVSGGSAAAALGFTAGNIAGAGNVANIDLVTVAEVKALVEAATPGVTVTNVGGAAKITRQTTGPGATVQVMTSGSAEGKFAFDTAVHAGSSGVAVNSLRVQGKSEGAYASKFLPKVSDATSGKPEEFNLQFLRGGVIVNSYPNLTMDPAGERYVETIVNSATGSRFLEAIDLGVVGSALERRPANGTGSNLTGGADGLVGLDDTDFVGASGASGKTGIRCFDTVQSLNLLACPGRATSAVHNAMVTYCEITRGGSVFAILDSPAATGAEDVIDYFDTTAGLLGTSEFAAAYWPRVRVANPNKSVFGTEDLISCPPSGHIAGVYARVDGSRVGGVYVPPAGVDNGQLRGVLGFDHDDCLDENKRDLVYPRRINPLTALRGNGRFIDGTKTLKGNGNFPSVAERRGVIFIEQSLKDGLQFARHKNNDESLREAVSRSADAFLLAQMNVGAFRSKDPAKAYFVDFGDGLNTESVIFANQLLGRVGLATQKPTDWVILRFSQKTRDLEEELAA